MLPWLQLDNNRRVQVLNQAAARTGIRTHAIEKDWWVTRVLQALFRTPWTPYLVFKGGTSLTKSWQLIERFSEDIDLAIDKEFLGYEGAPNKSKIERLRRRASEFVGTTFKEGLQEQLVTLGIPENGFELGVRYAEDSIRDPQVLELRYVSVLQPDPNPYLREQVLIEVGARSLREPSSQRAITAIVDEIFPDAAFAMPSFGVQSVEPKRTFLEKAFLLHELFQRQVEQQGYDRMSRHLYDLERLMDTTHGQEALRDKSLYQSIVEHRQLFNKVTDIDYTLHGPATLNFLPPEGVRQRWESDYRAMQETMIYGESLPFAQLLKRLQELQQRFEASALH
jgi:hypothetical protein